MAGELYKVFVDDDSPSFYNVIGYDIQDGVMTLHVSGGCTVILPLIHHHAIEFHPQGPS